MTAAEDGARYTGPALDHPDLPACWKDPVQREYFRKGRRLSPTKSRAGHGYPGLPGKTVYPKDKDADWIDEAHARARMDPDWVRELASGDRQHMRDIDGIRIHISYRPADADAGTEERPIHAYPKSGPGVVKNKQDGKGIERRLDQHEPIESGYTWAHDDRPAPE